MTLEGAEAKEVKEAVEYMRELRRDPQRFSEWADRVIEGWLKKDRSSRRRSKISRRS